MATLIIHPGRAHKDDVLSAAFLIAAGRVDKVCRREPTEADLEASDVYVVDVGGRHEPEKLNFDHHQLPRDAAPCCALTLVLEHLGLLDFAKESLRWFSLVELLYSKGPVAAAKALGTPPDVFEQTLDPIGTAVVRWIGECTEILPGQFEFELLRRTGQDYLSYLERLQERLAFLPSVTQRIPLGHGYGLDARGLGDLEDPLLGLEMYTRQHHPEAICSIATATRGEPGTVSLCRRQGYDDRLDFQAIKGREGVTFVHASGFLASVAPGVDVLPLLAASLKT